MGAICSIIGGWLKAGLDKVAIGLKWIWEAVCSLFSKACDLVRDLFQPLWLCCKYNRERTWSQTESSRVEVLGLDTSL